AQQGPIAFQLPLGSLGHGRLLRDRRKTGAVDPRTGAFSPTTKNGAIIEGQRGPRKQEAARLEPPASSLFLRRKEVLVEGFRSNPKYPRRESNPLTAGPVGHYSRFRLRRQRDGEVQLAAIFRRPPRPDGRQSLERHHPPLGQE